MIPNFLFPVHAGSSQGSHTSKYFGSIDSSENDHSRKQPAGGSSGAGGDGGEEQFIKCVLQDPIWLLMANTDDKVMMTYQLPVRYDRIFFKKRDHVTQQPFCLFTHSTSHSQ